MNKQTRHTLLLEKLGSAATPLSANDLARQLNVTRRTIERDLAELRRQGIAVAGERGRTGGASLGTEPARGRSSSQIPGADSQALNRSNLPGPEGRNQDYVASIEVQLRELAQGARRLLECLAVFDSSISREQLKAIGRELEDIVLENELDLLIESGLISSSPDDSGTVRFHDEITRSTVVSTLLPAERTALHAMAFAILRELQALGVDSDLDLYANHAVQAVQLVGVEDMAKTCFEVGSSALKRGDWEVARGHFQAALGECTNQTQILLRAQLLEGLGNALLKTVDPFTSERAIEILEMAYDTYIEAEERESALRIVSLPFSAVPGRTAAADLIRRGLALENEDPETKSRLYARLSAFNAIAEGNINAAELSAAEALTQASRTGNSRLISLAHAHVAQVAAHAFRSATTIEHAEKALTNRGSGIEPVAAFLSNQSASHAHLFAGEVEHAIRRAEAALAIAEMLQDHHRRLGVMWLLIRLNLDSGDLQQAARISDQALEIYPKSPIHLGLRAWLEFEIGNSDAGYSYLEQQMAVEADPDAPYGLAPVGMRTLMLSKIAGLTKDPKILQMANRSADSTTRRGFGTPFARVDAFQVAAGLATLQDDRFTAAQLASEYRSISDDFDVPGIFWHSAAQVQLLIGEAKQAQVMFEQAAEYLMDSKQWLSFVQLCEDYVPFLLERSDTGRIFRAGELLDIAIDSATSYRLVPHIEGLADLKHRVSATSVRKSPGIESLSDREHEVLQLISEGLSNSEIAVRLILSEHTVHRHVSSILGKLDVRSRTQAALLEQTHHHK